jgi:hypothetical protein
VDRLQDLLYAARRAGVPRIVIAREAEAGAGPVIPRPGGRRDDRSWKFDGESWSNAWKNDWKEGTEEHRNGLILKRARTKIIA